MTTLPLRSLLPATLSLAALLLSSCIENSTVLRVKKDGSGEIFARYYFSPQMTGMLGMMNGLIAGGLGEGAEGAPPSGPSADDLLKPSAEQLKEDAANYGEGVRYVSHEAGKNGNGWDGYLVVYEFDDISQIKIDPNHPPGPMDDLAKSNPVAAQAIEEGQKEVGELESPLNFAMADGVLTITNTVSSDAITEIGESAGGLGGGGLPGGGSISGPNGASIDPAAALQMAAGMFEGMRIAHFIRIEGEIAETNATYVDGTLITLSDLEPAKMISDPNFGALLKEAEAIQAAGKEPDQAKKDEIMEKVKKIQGAKLETQEQITIHIK